jgi:prepilin-type N-terminal cleavage/methylation domain-containing protein
MKFAVSHFSRGEHGMTLLELVVVIAILAVLMTVAMRSMTGVAQQSRFEATQRTLENIQEAILGPANDHQPDGSRVINGFIADIGRLPQAMLATNSDGTTSLTLNELLSPPTGALPFAVRQATGTNLADSSLSLSWDTNVWIPCGWRGPYLRLAVGETAITDGWGVALANPAPAVTNVVLLYRPDLSPVANPGDPIGVVVSLGADGVPGGTGYDSDLSVTASNYTASLVVTVSMYDTNGVAINSPSTNGDQVVVRVFGPDPENIGKIAAQALTNSLIGGPLNYLFTNSPALALTQGPRAVRAYLQTSSGVITNTSAIDYLNLHPGFNTAGLTLVRPY